jgi:hypothetical protein
MIVENSREATPTRVMTGGFAMTKVIVGLYDDVALAQRAVDKLLVEFGIPRQDISMLSNETIAAIPGAAEGSGEPGPLGDADVSGADLVPRLTELGVPQEAAEGYAEGVRRGGSLVVGRAEDARAAEATAIMDREGAADFSARIDAWRAGGWTGFDPEAGPLTPAEADAERRRWREQGGAQRAATAPLEGTTHIEVRRSMAYSYIPRG